MKWRDAFAIGCGLMLAGLLIWATIAFDIRETKANQEPTDPPKAWRCPQGMVMIVSNAGSSFSRVCVNGVLPEYR